MSEYGRKAIGETDVCPICGARIQATEEIHIDYDYLTVTFREDGGIGLDDIEGDDLGHQETLTLRVYCFNDHTAEQMEIEFRKQNNLPMMPVEG